MKIIEFRINPSPAYKGGYTEATVKVQNVSKGPAPAFRVQWLPEGQVGTPVDLQFDGLGSNESATKVFGYTYNKLGAFDAVAIIDPLDRLSETDETNNRIVRRVTVVERPGRRAHITVTFTTITYDVKNLGRFFPVDITVKHRVNGSESSTKHYDVQDDTYPLNKRFEFDLAEGEPLHVWTIVGDDDADVLDCIYLKVDETYDSQREWGKGSYTIPGPNEWCTLGGDHLYSLKLNYTISMTWLD